MKQQSNDRSFVPHTTIEADLGLTNNFFGSMKHANLTKYKYMESLGDGNLYEGYHKYKEEFEGLKNEMTKIYYELLEIRGILKFSRYLYELGIFKSYNGFSAHTHMYFIESFKMNHRALLTMQKTYDAYKKYKGKKC